MDVRVLDNNLLRELLRNGEGTNEGGELGKVAAADELAKAVDSLSLDNSEGNAKNLQRTLSCVEDILAFIDSKKKRRTELSRKLERVQSELVQFIEMTNDTVDLISELKDEEEGTRRFCLPGDVWQPFIQGKAGDPQDQLAQELSLQLWGETSLREIRSCPMTKSRVEALLGMLMKQHDRERELAEMRKVVSKATSKELEKLANSIRLNRA